MGVISYSTVEQRFSSTNRYLKGVTDVSESNTQLNPKVKEPLKKPPLVKKVVLEFGTYLVGCAVVVVDYHRVVVASNAESIDHFPFTKVCKS